ncbi:MAG TPA: LysR substrate-binding domain-containing protein [Stellaceae bacterium]|nr:LysR substrate-binding domain-containing protein [Stellaceae bacterium]
MSAFVRAAETGSFSRVARELRISQPSVSRMVASLEARLGVTLLLRTTRRVTPTEAGTLFLERARQILGDLEEATQAARGVDSLHGVLRIAMSSSFGTREVIPRLPGFLAQHPRLRLELLISDRTDDLVAEGADLALRMGRLAESGFGARLVGSAPRLAVASSAYLRERGEPETLADLARHDCIVGPGLSGEPGWSFSRAGAVTSLAVEGRVQVASTEGVMACVKAGLGIAVVSQWMCRAELARGELKAILPDYELDPVEVHALYPAGRRPSAKVRAFSDYLAAAIGEPVAASGG